MFDRVLIANRGEIACRIIGTCRRLGIFTIAVYSEADSRARHVRIAGEAVCIGAPPPRDSYLRIDAILAAAQATDAQAVHPGYGFLAENAAFAEACADAGLVFVGPPANAIRAMGSKSAAKQLMQDAGVPLLPGYHGDDQDTDVLQQRAREIGWPVIIKASAGGGGKGMRVVDAEGAFAAALASCRREAAASFGDARILIEKYVARPRHIEVQVFADTFGQVVHLFERDCSVQRRYQKVLEEAPAPGMTAERRAAMGDAACAAARAVGYVGAGTVEFIVSADGAFHFMEMNTRLQVEHPVTEMITGLDLVEWQLRIAAGEPLPLSQEQLSVCGHAIEARIYAEDPARGFLPSTGRLVHLSMPAASRNVRMDAGVEQGDAIGPDYDPLIAKLVVWDEDRERARRRLLQALGQCRIVGVASNVGFLSRLVASPSFAAAALDTGLIDREQEVIFPQAVPVPDVAFLLAALADLLREAEVERHRGEQHPDRWSPWQACDGWRLGGRLARTLLYRADGQERAVAATYAGSGFILELDGTSFPANGELAADGLVRAELAGRRLSATVIAADRKRFVFSGGQDYVLAAIDPLAPPGAGSATAGALSAPMPGKIVALLAAPGSAVEKGEPLLILEAMKMEHTIAAPAAGRLKHFHFAVGEQVAEGAELVELEPQP
ncbi:MAG: biotin carboxylase N-terminal domain-containing protein [Rhodospirillales bacterium]